MHPVDVHELVYNAMRRFKEEPEYFFLFAPSLQCDALIHRGKKVKFVAVERQHSGRSIQDP
jgi:hypothetical protein